MDGLQEFQFNSNYHWPTTIIVVPDYFSKYSLNSYFGFFIDHEKASFALNLFQTRMQFCVINFLFIGNQSLLQSPTHDSQNLFILQADVPISLYLTIAVRNYIKFEQEWIAVFEKTYTILVTKSQTILETAKFKLLVNNKEYVENFAVIFPSETTLQDEEPRLEICVVVTTPSLDLSKMVCQKFSQKNQNVVEIFTDAWIYFPFWFYDTVNDEEAEIEPFDRFSNKSIDLYLLKEIAQKENISIYFDAICLGVDCETFPYISYKYLSSFMWSRSIIFTKWSGLQWLTCYRKKFLSFDFYVSPFQLDLWIVLE
jgi:hypothetical protein